MRSVTGFIKRLALLTLVSGCGRREYVLITPQGDTLSQPVSITKIKARTMTLQLGGSNNTASAADNTKAGQRAESAAIGPNANANATTKKQGQPWLLYLLLVVAGAVGWEYLSRKVPGKWLPWRVGTS